VSAEPPRPADQSDSPPDLGLPAYVAWDAPPQPPLKFQHNYRRHLIFFGLTVITTTWVWSFGFMWAGLAGGLPEGVSPFAAFSWGTFVQGLWYSVPLLTILSAHEFGHYFACRYYRVNATLPYYLPLPLPPLGTLGAVIRIREPFPSKRALFDIGIAGPIAGFVALLPFLLWGLQWSTVEVIPDDAGLLYFGEPLLWKGLEWIYFGIIPDGSDVMLHPIGTAAWVGMLATALNLLPFGQLDGGHIIYAALGRRAAAVSLATLLLVVLLTLQSASWFLMALLLVVAALTLGFRHPRMFDEDVPLDPTRQWLTVVAAVMFALCFMPVPIEIIGGS